MCWTTDLDDWSLLLNLELRVIEVMEGCLSRRVFSHISTAYSTRDSLEQDYTATFTWGYIYINLKPRTAQLSFLDRTGRKLPYCVMASMGQSAQCQSRTWELVKITTVLDMFWFLPYISCCWSELRKIIGNLSNMFNHCIVLIVNQQ